MGRRTRIAASYEAIMGYGDGLARRLIDGLGSVADARIQGISNPNRMIDRALTSR